MSVIVRGPTLSEQVCEFVREHIINGTYKPGQVLVEAELAEELGVSRTPVGSALIVLKERGLLEEQGGRLAVAKQSIMDVVDLYRCRLALDSLATRLAAELITGEGLARLEHQLRVWERPPLEDDLHALWVADMSFHEIIYQVTGNRHLIRFAQIAHELAAIYRRNTVRRLGASGQGRSREVVRAEHQKIFESLVERDPDLAEVAAREHVENIIVHLNQLEVVNPNWDLEDSGGERSG